MVKTRTTVDADGMVWGQRFLHDQPVSQKFKVRDPAYVHERVPTPRALDVTIRWLVLTIILTIIALAASVVF